MTAVTTPKISPNVLTTAKLDKKLGSASPATKLASRGGGGSASRRQDLSGLRTRSKSHEKASTLIDISSPKKRKRPFDVGGPRDRKLKNNHSSTTTTTSIGRTRDKPVEKRVNNVVQQPTPKNSSLSTPKSDAASSTNVAASDKHKYLSIDFSLSSSEIYKQVRGA